MFPGLFFGYVPIHLIVTGALEVLGCAIVLFLGLSAARMRPRALVAALGGLLAGAAYAVNLIVLVTLREHQSFGPVNWLFRHPHADTTLDWVSGIGILLIGVGFALVAFDPRPRSRTDLAPDVL